MEDASKAISNKREAFMASLRKNDLQNLFESRRARFMKEKKNALFSVEKSEVCSQKLRWPTR